jgi:hypothetical protein
MLLGGSSGCSFFAFAEFRGAILVLRGLIGRRVIGVRLVEMRVVVTAGRCEGFTGQQFDGGGRVSASDGGARRVSRGMGVIVTMIVVFEVFEDIADVEKGVAIQADVDESRLHAWENASNLAFVDAADEREHFLPLEVELDKLSFFQNRDSALVRARGYNQFFRHEYSLRSIAAGPTGKEVVQGKAPFRNEAEHAGDNNNNSVAALRSKPEGVAAERHP